MRRNGVRYPFLLGNMSCLLNGDGTTVGPCPQNTYNAANNHITTSGYSYDAAGNVTNDTVHTYTWDAEGRIATVEGGMVSGTILFSRKKR